MKIGIVYCCYGNPNYIDNCLKPWIEAKKTNDILIAAVHGQFKEYHDLGIEDNDIDSQKQLLDRLVNKNLDFVYIQNEYNNEKIYQSEAEIRDKGLQYLLKQNCDLMWLLDNDEFYTLEQIENIIKYINKEDNQFHGWFSINFKNHILDGKQWVDGFCPPRIFRTKTLNFTSEATLDRFFWDNDVEYKTSNGTLKSYKNFPDKSIPKNIAHIKHMTWLNSNGKSKVNYQLKHFGHCSYKWSEEKQELEFDLDFHYKNGLGLPIINKDE